MCPAAYIHRKQETAILFSYLILFIFIYPEVYQSQIHCFTLFPLGLSGKTLTHSTENKGWIMSLSVRSLNGTFFGSPLVTKDSVIQSVFQEYSFLVTSREAYSSKA